MTEKKGKLLTGPQKDKLRELDQENRQLSQESESRKKVVRDGADKERKAHKRKSTDVIKAYHDGFEKQKKELDQWKVSQERKLRKEYDGKLETLKSDRRSGYADEELILEGNLAEIEAWEAEESLKIEREIGTKIGKLVAARKVITGPSEEAEKEAKEAEKEAKKAKKKEDDTPVEVPVEQPAEPVENQESAVDCTEVGENE